MLRVYTRHYPPCQQTDINYRRCRCPKWINGNLPNGEFIRVSAQTRSWEAAETKARTMELDAVPGKKPRATLRQAVHAFLEDEKARHLRRGTTGQSETLLSQQLLPWAREREIDFLDQLTVALLSEFRAYWSKELGNGQNTCRRKHERLCGFFHFCIRNEWLTKNPARLLKAIRVVRVPTGYYTREEFDRIVDATYAYGNWKGGHDFKHRGLRLRALLLVMRWGGLAITDAVTLERNRLGKDGRLFLYRAKTGVPVYVPLPPDVVQTLRAVPNLSPRYFFWSGAGAREDARKPWDRSLRRLFKSANLREPDDTPKRCTAHMCRDTFAVELLLAGVPLDQVSLLLAHDSIKVTEKHYAPFVKARQLQLETSARQGWGKVNVLAALARQTSPDAPARPV
jgi:integrase